MAEKLWDYTCLSCGADFEAWGENGAPAPCPACYQSATQCVGRGYISLDGTDLGFPTTADKWADRHERHEEPGKEI